uniref:Protein FAM227B n=1 Tax=Leptobrachium leishanense TaxID=445787 RepID=A0A8C5WGE7_9ANUR
MQKPPSTFEEFLDSQHLKDWPEDPYAEESLAVACTPDVIYTLHQINEDLTGRAPFNNKTYAIVDENVSQISSQLEKCASQICFPCTYSCLLSTTETFLTEANVEDLQGRTKANSKEPNDVTPKEYHVEKCIFQGFKKTHVTQLPRNLEPMHILTGVAKKQSFKGSKSHLFNELYLSNASVTILQDSFWWFFLHNFKPNHEQQGKLFNRISDNYANLFFGAPQSAKDFFFKIYPDCMSQAIYTTFYEAFPDSLAVFNNEFKSEVIDLIFQWMCGIKPMPYLWTKWDLKCPGRNSPSSPEKIRNKYMDISQINLIPGSLCLDGSYEEKRTENLIV